MKRIRFAAFLLVVFIMIFSVSGCESQELKALNATALFSVKDIPDDFTELSDQEKEHFIIKLNCVQTKNKLGDEVNYGMKKKVKLTSKNNLSVSEYLEPGKYVIKDVVFINRYADYLVINEDDLEGMEFSIESGKCTDIDITLKNISKKTEPSDQILKAPVFSHLIQIGDTVYEIDKLKDNFSFNLEDMSRSQYRSCDELPGLTVLFDATDEHHAAGITISSPDYILGGGIRTGIPISKLADARDGIIGKPVSCKGTPLIDFDFGMTGFVFVDEKTGEKIEAYTEGPLPNVMSINYTF